MVANDGIEEVVKREVERSSGRRRSVGELESLLTAQASAPPSAPMPPPPSLPGMPLAPLPPGSAMRVATPPPNVRRQVAEDDENPTNIAPIPAQVRGSIPSALTPSGGADPEEQTHWREVYALFIAKWKECNEPTEGLTYEKFTSTLQRHKEALVARTQCRAVRFQVMMSKEGKATLKASPVR